MILLNNSTTSLYFYKIKSIKFQLSMHSGEERCSGPDRPSKKSKNLARFGLSLQKNVRLECHERKKTGPKQISIENKGVFIYFYKESGCHKSSRKKSCTEFCFENDVNLSIKRVLDS